METTAVNKAELDALSAYISNNIDYSDRLDLDDIRVVSVLENALFVIKQLKDDREALREKLVDPTKRVETIRKLWVSYSSVLMTDPDERDDFLESTEQLVHESLIRLEKFIIAYSSEKDIPVMGD